MSVEAISWVLGLKVERSSAKFVLVAMANCANNDLTCWPSIQYLADATCQDRKTVLENIKRLKDAGFIADTELRKGHTGQVIVYQLKNPENGTVKESQKRNSTENGTVPKPEANSPVFSVKQSRFSVVTVPKTGHGTIKEPSIEPSRNHKSAAAFVLPQWIPIETWSAFMETRKAKKAKSTDYALGLIVESLENFSRDGHDPIEILKNSIKGGWSDVYEPKDSAKKKGAEPQWRTEQRTRTQIAAPGVAVGGKPAHEFFTEIEAKNVTSARLG